MNRTGRLFSLGTLAAAVGGGIAVLPDWINLAHDCRLPFWHCAGTTVLEEKSDNQTANADATTNTDTDPVSVSSVSSSANEQKTEGSDIATSSRSGTIPASLPATPAEKSSRRSVSVNENENLKLCGHSYKIGFHTRGTGVYLHEGKTTVHLPISTTLSVEADCQLTLDRIAKLSSMTAYFTITE